MSTRLKMALLTAGATLILIPCSLAQQPGLVIGGFGGGIGANRGEPVTGAPYSADAITETSETRADGNRITHTTTTRIYRDSQGRERREETLDPLTGRSAEPQRAPTIFISDPIARASYMLSVLQHTALRMPMPGAAPSAAPNNGFAPTIQFTPAPGPAGAGAQIPEIIIQQGGHIEVTGPGGPAGPVGFASPSPAPRRVERLEPKTIEGLAAEGTRTTETIPANSVGNGAPFEIVTESWVSPELKVELMNRRSDPRTGEVVLRLANIRRAEPDRSLFEVPSDYTIQELPSVSGGIVPGGVSVGVRPR